MKPELSIIMPCYNCSSTLEEAVESCFKQNLTNFEVVMVDDGSTDNTRTVMESLAKRHPEIKLVFHEKNKGGGAARNTAVAESAADSIFCLDGDDILADNMLPKMLGMLHEKQLDGVLFEETKFFYDSNTHKTESVKNKIVTRPITLADLFKENQGFLTKINFLYTKKAFTVAGGYPTHHGFDTQTFGLRFVSKNLSAMVCEGTYYLHRRSKKKSSYFMREYSQGKLSYNTYLMYEDIIHLFSDEVIQPMLDFNILDKNRLGKENLGEWVSEQFKILGEGDFFVKPTISDNFCNKFRKAVQAHIRKDYVLSLNIYSEIIKEKSDSQILNINILRIFLTNASVDTCAENIVYETFSNKRNKISPSLVCRILHKITDTLCKN